MVAETVADERKVIIEYLRTMASREHIPTIYKLNQQDTYLCKWMQCGSMWFY